MAADASSTAHAHAHTGTRAVLAIVPSVLLAGVAGGIAFPILPSVGVRAGLPVPFIGVILAANRAARVVSNPIVGTLSDRFGGRRTLIVGMVLQIIVMALYVLGIRTGHPGLFFLGGRLLHGPGSASVFVAAQLLALHAGGTEHGGRAAGSVRAAMAVGVPIGLVAGGLLSDRVGDAQTFELALVALVAASLAAFLLVPDLRVPVRRAASLRDVIAALADRRLAAVGALNFAATFSASGMVLTTLALLVRQRGISFAGFGEKGTSGLLMGGMVLSEALVMSYAGRLGDRRHWHAHIAAVGMAVLVVALAVTGLAQTRGWLSVGIALVGIGVGGLGPSLLAIINGLVPPERRGAAVGVMGLCGDTGGALGPLVGTALFAGKAELPYFVSAALLASFLPVAVWLIGRAPRKGSLSA